MVKRDPRNSSAPAIGCATHATPQSEMPCAMCRRQGELFPRSTAAEQTRMWRYQ
jgi:hypothetical protein